MQSTWLIPEPLSYLSLSIAARTKSQILGIFTNAVHTGFI